MNVTKLRGYSKSILAGVLTVGYAIQAALSDDVVNGEETGAIIALILTTLGVFTVRNEPAPVEPSTLRADGTSGGF